jgi:NAD(P)-dependent dehydrogenase (short-subunit alcohol dehydrogenase family)
MARVFITGSSDGLGLAAARTLLDGGHHVVLHARSRNRAAVLSDLAPRARGVAIGDLTSAAETRALADQVNALGRMDAVIHNAGIYLEPARGSTPEGHARALAVNVLAPYMLTAWIDRPDRLIYLSSGMHREGGRSLDDIDWTKRKWNASGSRGSCRAPREGADSRAARSGRRPVRSNPGHGSVSHFLSVAALAGRRERATATASIVRPLSAGGQGAARMQKLPKPSAQEAPAALR